MGRSEHVVERPHSAFADPISSIVNRQSSIVNPKIVVVRLGAMGDILFMTPALRGLKARYPGAHITFVAMKKWAFLFRNSPSVDRFWGLAYREPGALGRLAHESFDLLVNLHEAEDGARICQAIDATERRGHQWIDGRVVPDENSALLSRDKSVLKRLADAGGSYPELYCRIARVEAGDTARLGFDPGAWASLRADLFLLARGLLAPGSRGGRRPIALHTHSRGTPAKTWPAEAVREVARALPGERFAVLGYRADRALTRELEDEPNVVVSYHSMPVQGAILRRCALFVGIDSGPRQVALAVGTPTLCLLGSRPRQLIPFGPRDRALEVQEPCAPCFEEECPRGVVCIGRIDPGLIVETVRKMIKGAGQD